MRFSLLAIQLPLLVLLHAERVLGQPMVRIVEDVSLEVVPCAPGYYCAEDGSTELCPEGSEHVVLSDETDLTEFAICSSSQAVSQTRVLGSEVGPESSIIDIGFTIDLPLDEQATAGFWEALDWTLPMLLDVSYQEYLTLDVSLCKRGHYCKEPNLSLPCAAGTFGPSEGLSACFQCPAGLPSVEGSTHFRNCTGGVWIPLRVPDTPIEDGAAELQAQLAAFYGMPKEAMVWIS